MPEFWVGRPELPVDRALAPMGSPRCAVQVARRVRVQYEHALYHVMKRGNYRRDTLFVVRGRAGHAEPHAPMVTKKD
jgi:hypothetical protein